MSNLLFLKQVSRPTLLVGSLISFLVAILANIIAAWIQQIVFQNAFTPMRILAMLVSATVGLGLVVWLNTSGMVWWAFIIGLLYVLLQLFIFSQLRTCPYHGNAKADTFIGLIDAESDAVLNEDTSIIKAIFADDAVIWDASSGQFWFDPVDRYTFLFENTNFTQAEHFSFKTRGSGIKRAVVTSGSRGIFFTDDNPLTPHTYENPAGSDVWTYGKDDYGCWVITSFIFNAQPSR